MAVSTQSFTQFVQNQVAAIQGTTKALLDFSIGSILRALVESVAGVALFLQAQVLQLLATTRLATSSGADVDSFVGDYGFSRSVATVSAGYLTFARFTATAQALIPVGTQARSFDGSQQFAVLPDTTNTAYNPTLKAYVVAANVASLAVLAQSVNAGSAANVSANTVTQILSAVPGIDTVTNASGFSGGSDAESDAALKAGFVGFIASLSKSTGAAIKFAASQVAGVMSLQYVENMTYTGSVQYGNFYLVIDDGTGNPSSPLLTSVYNAVDAVRPLTSTFQVIGPTKVTANVVMVLTTDPSYSHGAVVALVQAALTAYINALPLGAGLPYFRLAQIAFDASAGVTDVTGITLNGATSDIAPNIQTVIRAGTVAVS